MAVDCRFAPDIRFRGDNPADGALIDFYVRSYTGEPVKITVTNANHTPVAKLSGPGTPGISRLVWDLKPSKELLNEYGGAGQKYVPTGDYIVELTYGKVKQTQKLHVEIAPGVETR